MRNKRKNPFANGEDALKRFNRNVRLARRILLEETLDLTSVHLETYVQCPWMLNAAERKKRQARRVRLTIVEKPLSA